MTTVQIASTVEVIEGASGTPFARITHVGIHGSCTYVPQTIESVNFPQLVAAGFEIDDPQGFVLCHCEQFKAWWMIECDACYGEHLDTMDDRQMYSDLRMGG